VEKHVLDTIERRLDAHGKELDTVEKCLERLTVLTERMDNTESDHEERLRALEGHDGELWSKVVMTAISSIVSAIIAASIVTLGIG
jgi:hypothetical protein